MVDWDYTQLLYFIQIAYEHNSINETPVGITPSCTGDGWLGLHPVVLVMVDWDYTQLY